MDKVRDIHDLNARLWAWLDECYHKEPHSALEGLTPLERYRKDLTQIRPLGTFASRLDELFLHRHERLVRKDGTVSYGGQRFEVPFDLIGKTVLLVVDPHKQKVLGVEAANRVGGGVSPAVLPHHRAYGSVHGGSYQHFRC